MLIIKLRNISATLPLFLYFKNYDSLYSQKNIAFVLNNIDREKTGTLSKLR